MKKLMYFIVVSFLFISCSKAPISGRNQLMIVSEPQMVAQSYRAYNNVLKQSKVLNNKDAKMVKKVGNRISMAVEKYFRAHPKENPSKVKYDWDFNLLESKEPNAWCMPGGKVAVYTGILPYTQNEQGLAVVMSHEIAHAIAQHSREQASQAMIQNLGGNIAGQIGVPVQLYGGISNLVMLKYSRTHETEADKMGLVFMKLAGYDPNYAVTFWQRMSQNGGQKPIEFLSTHPSDKRRIHDIKKYLASSEFKSIK